MRFLIRSILVVNVVGAVTALCRHRVAMFAGVGLPGPPVVQALTVGTSMSAPPVVLGVLVAGARRGRTDLVGGVAALFLVGILGEPDTWRALRQPASDPLTTVCVALEIVLPAALLREARRTRSRVGVRSSS